MGSRLAYHATTAPVETSTPPCEGRRLAKTNRCTFAILIITQDGAGEKVLLTPLIDVGGHAERARLRAWSHISKGNFWQSIERGEERLPGVGLEQYRQDLRGVDPEDYSDIDKYEVLADVA